MAAIELLSRKLTDAGFMDAAITFGAGTISFTAQIENVDAVEACRAATGTFEDSPCRIAHIEVDPCLQVEPEVQIAAV